MGTMEVVQSVKFGFMTDEEVKKQSVIKITNPNLLDILQKPIPGGLYDPAMGPLDEASLCKSCGQRSYHCAGHCGHIDLVSLAYNPLMFSMLSNLLNKTCFYCFQFRSSTQEVDHYVSQLKLIAKGDIVGAKKLSFWDKKTMDSVLPDDMVDGEDSPRSFTSHSSELTDSENQYEHNKQACWDSIQLTEAMSILNEFLKKKEKKCRNCECNNPKITKPTFGWFNLVALSDTQTRSNAIRGKKLNVTYSDEKPSSEVVNDYSWNDDPETNEATSFIVASNSTEKPSKKYANRGRNSNQDLEESNNYSSGQLLPTEVRDILRRLWENEAPLCSYLCDIQQQQCELSGKTGDGASSNCFIGQGAAVKYCSRKCSC